MLLSELAKVIDALGNPGQILERSRLAAPQNALVTPSVRDRFRTHVSHGRPCDDSQLTISGSA